MKKIAITGSFGTGKSTVGEILKNEGYPVIDTDHIVHSLLSTDNECTKRIVETFGDDIKQSGKYYINKKKLASIVFNDLEKRKSLEDIVHPEVRNEVARFFTSNTHKKYAFVLIPLLFETSQRSSYDEAWCVYCDEKTQMQRLLAKGFSPNDIKKRIASQIAIQEKIEKSDFSINNNGSVSDTTFQILERLKSKA